MKHPREWTDTERERFRQRHEAMCKELQIEKTKQNEKYTPVIKNIDGKALHFLSKVLLHKMTNAAERIVEKYKDIHWLNEEPMKLLICPAREYCNQSEICEHAKEHTEKEQCTKNHCAYKAIRKVRCIEAKG